MNTGLEAGEQEARLSAVSEAALARSEEVTEYYRLLAARWDTGALAEYGGGVSDGDMKAIGIWLGEQKAWKLRKKLETVRDAVRKAGTEGLEEAEAAALEPYLEPEAIAALKQTKLVKELFRKSAEKPRDYLSDARSASGLNDFAKKTSGGLAEADLSKFYDGARPGADSTAGLPDAAGVAVMGGNKILAPEARGTAANTIKHAAPGSLPGGGVEDAEPAPAVKKGKGRALTEDELANARSMYGDKIDYSKVRVITGEDMTLWGKILTHKGDAVVWGNTIYFPNGENKSTVYDSGRDSGWLIHELGHVYQYQEHGWGYIPKSAWDQLTKGKDAYKYELKSGKPFEKYGVEQQAEIMRDYFDYNIPAEKRPEVEKMLREEGLLGGPGGG